MSESTSTKTPEQTALDERLARTRAARAELDVARAKREASAATLAAVEAEERALADETTIEAAIVSQGPIGVAIGYVKTRLGVIIVKRAQKLPFRQFQRHDSPTSVDCEKLLKPCLVHPDWAAFEAMQEELPMALTSACNVIVSLAGAGQETSSGKS